MGLLPRGFGFDGPGAGVAIASIVGPILASFLVFNRIYWRIALVHVVGLDDLCIILSLIFFLAQCTVNLVAVNAGYGRASASLPPLDLYLALQMFYLDQIFYKLTINLTKLSILALYLRIFSQLWFRRTCQLTALLVSCYAFASTTATIFQCTPVAHTWNKSLPGTCINLTAFWYANAIYNFISDSVILLSVPWVVWSLSLSLRQRIGLTLVFGLGIFVFVTSILRFTTLDVASKTSDPTAGTARSTLWTTIEACTAVACACLPMLRTPIQRLWPGLFPTRISHESTDVEGVALETSARSRSEWTAHAQLNSSGGVTAQPSPFLGTARETQHPDVQHGYSAKNPTVKDDTNVRHADLQTTNTMHESTKQLHLMNDKGENNHSHQHQPNTSYGSSNLHALLQTRDSVRSTHSTASTSPEEDWFARVMEYNCNEDGLH